MSKLTLIEDVIEPISIEVPSLSGIRTWDIVVISKINEIIEYINEQNANK